MLFIREPSLLLGLFTGLLVWHCVTSFPRSSASYISTSSAGSSPSLTIRFTLYARKTDRPVGLFAQKCTPLPIGLSPWEKSRAKNLDLPGQFRQWAAQSIGRALQDGLTLMEIDVPTLVGSKSFLDDVDNIQELNANRDWCVQLMPLLSGSSSSTSSARRQPLWLVFPDDKECELARQAWPGRIYQESALYTSLRAAVEATSGQTAAKSWGTTLASTLNRMQGGSGLLMDDTSNLDALEGTARLARLQVLCQPGNGGPVEDWINAERLHQASSTSGGATCIVNGALDKVRDGYYPGLFFPALAAAVPFYRQFQGVLILKPLQGQGLSGWLFRRYPEPWQVVWQRPRPGASGSQTVDNLVVLTTDQRPTYAEAMQAMVQQAAAANNP